MKKEHLKKENNKRKKEKWDNLHENESAVEKIQERRKQSYV